MDRANVKLHVGAQYGHFDEMFGIQHTEIRQKQVFLMKTAENIFAGGLCVVMQCCTRFLIKDYTSV